MHIVKEENHIDSPREIILEGPTASVAEWLEDLTLGTKTGVQFPRLTLPFTTTITDIS